MTWDLIQFLLISVAFFLFSAWLMDKADRSRAKRRRIEYERDHYLIVQSLKAHDPDYEDVYETRFHVKWNPKKRRYDPVEKAS